MNPFFATLQERYPQLACLDKPFHDALTMLYTCIKQGGKILVCGNGGSAADAEHIVGELMKGFLLPRPLPQSQKEAFVARYGEQGRWIAENLQGGIPAVSLVSGVSLPTAFANDVAGELAFAQQVYALGKPHDILWGISTSGTAKNVNHALRVARMQGLATLGFTGKSGGEMASLCDVELRPPSHSTPEIQEYHLPLYHALCAALEEMLFGVHACVEKTFPNKLPFKPELIVFDFDGIMTDNAVYVDQNGQEMVRCSREDSLGLSMLRKAGQAMLILSTETNTVVAKRAEKLGIPCSHGCSNKKAYLEQYFSQHAIDPQKVLYMGNDINDKEAMELAGCAICPADAHEKIKPLASLVLQKNGGHGAVRELCDMIIQ